MKQLMETTSMDEPDSQGNECREASADSQNNEAGEDEGSSCKLETIREIGPDRTLHGEDSAGQQQVHGLHQGPVDCGSRSLCCRGSRRNSRTRFGKSKCGPSLLCKMSRPDGGKDESGNSSAVLGLCSIPEMQRDYEPRVSRTTSPRSSDDGRETQQEGLVGVQEQHGGEHGRHGWNNGPSCNSHAGTHRDRSQLGSIESSHSDDADSAIDSGGQSGSDQGRDGVDQQLAPEVSPVNALSESEIRDRIAKGQKRRRLAKAGTVKRWIGNCQKILSAACLLTFLAVSAGSSFVSQKLFGDDRPDVVEIFGGAAEVSFQFSRRGWNVLQPLDLVYGFDLRDPKHREEVRNMLERERPRLAIVEYPCTLWTQLAATNYRSKQEDQILRLRRPVYGRPDAPRAWYEQISKFIMGDMGFERSILDPALFVHRDNQGNPNGMLVLHVDDLMVATDGGEQIESAVSRLFNRFPFGEWDLVKDCAHGVTYCGKEIKVGFDNGERTIVLGQKGFSEGRLETVPIQKERKQTPDSEVTEEERSDFRSVLGSLQWLSTQSRPDISFGVNQLQKRVNCLTVRDLEAANKLVRVVKQNESSITFRNLGKDVAVVSWHDAGLYNSLGVELDEDDNDLLQSLADKKLLYSQKGCVIGLCKISDLERTMEVPVNFLGWKSKTNRRVLESSFAAETHAALMGYHMGQFQRTLLMEIYYGEWAVKHGSDFEWEPYMPLRMMTDCKSVFDTIKRDSQSIGDKSNCVNIAVLRQLCVADPSPKGDRARMMWLPTRHQLADPLTKGGRHHMMQDNLTKGCAVFHGLSAKRCKSKEIGVSVKVV